MPTLADQRTASESAVTHGADLESLLAAAEHPAIDAGPSPSASPAAATPTEHPAALSPRLVVPTEEAPAPRAMPTRTGANTGVRSRLTKTTFGGPAPKLSTGRYHLIPALRERLPMRQLAWVAWSALAMASGAATGLTSGHPALVVAAAIGLGAWAAWPERLVEGPLLGLATVATSLLVGLLGASSPTLGGTTVLLAGTQVLAAGGIAGLGVTFLDHSPADRWRRIQGLLGGAAGAGVGWWAAQGLVGGAGTTGLSGAAAGLALGLVSSQALLAASLVWKQTDRIPRPGRIRATLAPSYRAPCLEAWSLDRCFARQAPDPDTRDGLGEVAAWIYRLQWTCMSLDREIDTLSGGTADTGTEAKSSARSTTEPHAGHGLEARRDALLDRARQSKDDFTAQRLRATAGHLDQLAGHCDSLVLERNRTAAMSEYASAFLEEARAGLALARVQPGEQVPDRLGDVLTRLRSHADAGDARRRTAREVNALS